MQNQVAGGDGTASWLLGVVADLKLPRPPPIATVPLGTGNNLPFAFGWVHYLTIHLLNVLNPHYENFMFTWNCFHFVYVLVYEHVSINL